MRNFTTASNIRGVTVTVVLSAERDSPSPSIDALRSAVWEGQVAGTFAKETGAKVVINFAPPTVDARLAEYLEQLKKPEHNNVDVYAIDVISIGILGSIRGGSQANLWELDLVSTLRSLRTIRSTTSWSPCRGIVTPGCSSIARVY